MESMKVVGDEAVIKTKDVDVFDREKRAMYTIRISATDSGNPPMTSYTNVYVEVGDKNDNKPSSGGSVAVKLNAYKGQFIGGNIGKVYIKVRVVLSNFR